MAYYDLHQLPFAYFLILRFSWTIYSHLHCSRLLPSLSKRFSIGSHPERLVECALLLFTGSSLPGLKVSSRLAFVVLLDLTHGDNLRVFLVVDTAQDED